MFADGVEVEEYDLIDLSEKEITSFEGKSTKVKQLCLCDNQLVSFSSEGAFPNLKELFLSYNRLVSFSAAGLQKLEFLDLCYNQLTSFSFVHTAELSKLKILWLDDNRPTLFSPVGEGAFPNLEKLYLSNNRLTSFMAKEGAFPNLEKLYLSNNRLTSFMAEEGAFPNLKELVLRNNTDLEVFNVSAPKLEGLWVKYTKLRFLDRSLIQKVQDRKDLEVYYHAFGTKRLVTEAFHKDCPVAEEIGEHLTR